MANTPTPADEIVPLNRLRAAIGRRMVEAKQQVPHFYVTSEIEMSEAMALRARLNTLVDEAGKISVNDMVLKAAALALGYVSAADYDGWVQPGAMTKPTA